MYRISVPIPNRIFKRGDREKYVEQLKEMGVYRVFLTTGIYEMDGEKLEEKFDELKDNVAYLKEKGFEVATWLWTFWINNHPTYEYMKFVSGRVSKSFVCPSCEEFRAFAGEYVKRLAECGVEMILFDDDYRYGHLDGAQGLGCVCDNHIRYAEEILGEKFPENALEKYLIEGGRNKYRSAWLKANKYYLLKFAEDMRKSVDEVNPNVRIGLCSCMSVWDYDGASPIEIVKTLAGNTRPFMRLIGAPYWATKMSWGNRLQDVIELERMELSWCKDEDIEIIGEGDVFPRPRYSCPSSYLEGFDTALRTDGRADGILKYVFDYAGNTDYETGYIDRHIKNTGLYKKIDRIFGGKDAIGIRIYEKMQKFEDMLVPKAGEGGQVVNMFFSPAARMLAGLSIPTIYDGDGISGIVFGENAKYIPETALDNGLILDARAAEILTEKGIDVGITELGENLSEKLATNPPTEEYFTDDDTFVAVDIFSGVYAHTLSEKGDVQSYFVNGNDKYPASYIYENKDGQRFFVLLFDGYFASEKLIRQYTRQRQLVKNIEWLSNKKLPAVITANPDLYVMCKEKDGVLAVGLWNFFADSICEPVIKLNKVYDDIKFVNCDGTLSGDTVTLSKLGAFEFAFFEVK